MLPTARQARGRPAIAATSPYVATRPGGIRRTAFNTRVTNGVTSESEAEARGCLEPAQRDPEWLFGDRLHVGRRV